MEGKQELPKWLPIIVLIIVFLVSLACKAVTKPAIVATPSQTEISVSEPSTTINPTDTIVPPTATEAPSATIAPTSTSVPPNATQTPIPIGFGRNNPYPRSEIVSAPNWDVQVLEVKRGEEAWKDIQAANMFNEVAPEGMEYLLIKLHVKSTYTDNDEHGISGCDFNVTGDHLIRYTCGMVMVVAPEPRLDARLFTGGETEGWSAFIVAQGEGNLILVNNESFNFSEDAIRYIALDEGATIGVSSELGSIKPTDLGIERNNPASRVDKIISEDWEVSVVEVIRGDVAWKMMQEVNQFNEPPVEGMEYIAVRIHSRFIGIEDKSERIDGSFFKTTGSANVLYDPPSVVSPAPSLDISLYPGGEYDGWIVVQAAKNETGIVLVFDPIFDFTGSDKRFISLEP